MAAYAALVSLMNDLDLIPNHPVHSFSFDHKQITSLSQTVNFLIHFMDIYDSHGCSREAAQVLESRIADVAHAAHDVIESHVVDQIQAGSTRCGKARSYFLLDLQKAIDEMEFVKRKTVQFKAKSGVKVEQSTYSAPTSSEPPLTSAKNEMVGLDDAVDRLMDILTSQVSSRLVIPIVGMGGLGKTTLAKNVVEKLSRYYHFHVNLWATVTQEYSVENILAQLVYGIGENSASGSAGALGVQLYQMLWARRYLVVLDDMWSVGAWDKIQNYLPNDGKGSRVIVTTRLSNLATHLTSSPASFPSPFEMSFLDDDKSWQLFCGKAFGEEDCPVELEEIGRKIVKRCRGLPLSLVVIGGHFRRSSRAIEYWEKFGNCMNPILSLGADDECLEIISMSYDHLPPHLKPCFLYLGIFKEDELIRANELLDYWVCEGFLKAKEGSSMEEAAEDYLKDLIDRNLILVRETSWNVKTRLCGIHDTVRELCLKVMKKEKFIYVLQDKDTTQGGGIGCRERRVVIPERKLDSDMINALESAPLLRSLMRPQLKNFLDDNLWADLRLLRISHQVNNYVVLENDGPPYLANDPHFRQLNLRWLDIVVSGSKSRMRSLNFFHIPSSVSLLWNMQSLSVQYPFHTTLNSVEIIVPCEIWEMPQLRQLLVIGGYLPDPVPVPNEEDCIVLRNLHTLSVTNVRLTEQVCKRMPNIKVLTLTYGKSCGGCEAASYYCAHNLGRFNKLQRLTIIVRNYDSKWRDVILSFTFPASLEVLCLWNPKFHWEELIMMFKSFDNLASLELNSIKGSEWNLVDEKFSCLKELKIHFCVDLVDWNADSSHFPVLEILYIWKATKLSEIPFDFGEIPTLRRIELRACSSSAAVSAVRIVVDQESLGNYDLQLHLQFWDTEQAQRFQEMVEQENLTIPTRSVNMELRGRKRGVNFS